MKSNFAERLSELMDEANLNALQLTTIIGCGNSAINRYKRGELPSLNMLVRFADYFQCTTDFLLGLTDESTAKTFLPIPPFSERLPFLLEHFEISAYKLQKITGIGETTMRDWKKDITSPAVDSIIRIAEKLECSVEFVIGRTNWE